jgi:hypothetical protein
MCWVATRSGVLVGRGVVVGFGVLVGATVWVAVTVGSGVSVRTGGGPESAEHANEIDISRAANKMMGLELFGYIFPPPGRHPFVGNNDNCYYQRMLGQISLIYHTFDSSRWIAVPYGEVA